MNGAPRGQLSRLNFAPEWFQARANGAPGWAPECESKIALGLVSFNHETCA